MKRILGVVIALVIVAGMLLCGCSAEPAAEGVATETASVAEAPAAEAPAAEAPAAETPAAEAPAAEESTAEAPATVSEMGTEADMPAIREAAASLSTDGVIVGYVASVFEPFMLMMHQGAVDACAAYGVELKDVTQNSNASNALDQAQAVEDLIAMGIDILVVSPDDDSLMPMLKDCVETYQIPVVLINTNFPDWDEKVTYVGLEDAEACYQGGLAVLDMLPDGGKGAGMVIASGVEGNRGAIDRIAGYTRAAEERGATVLASDYCNWDSEATASKCEDWITKFGDDLDVICTAADHMCTGAIQAVEAAGRTGDILICGMGGYALARDAFAAGTMDATEGMKPYEEGYWGVECALANLAGDTAIPKFITTGITILTKDNFESTDHKWIE